MNLKYSIEINHELRVFYPEGFRMMEQGERAKFNQPYEGPGECLSDPERHILISIGYQQPPKLALMLLNSKDLVKNMEPKIRKPMQPYGYKLLDFCNQAVGGEKAYGFAYEYEAQGIGMYAESYALKKGKTVYYFHFYTRKAFREESAPVWGRSQGT